LRPSEEEAGVERKQVGEAAVGDRHERADDRADEGERAAADGDHHHHLVCRDCGKVEAFSDSRLERAIDRVADGLGYSVEEHEVVLLGACADCS
jgi:Fur family ferric uptake transcriptional regulator